MDKTQNENSPAASRNQDGEAPTLPPLAGGPPQVPASQATQGVAAAAPGPDPALAFLAPPQGPGEIGRLGPYRVLKVLGQGGMGVVFQAEDVRLQRVVALKAMLPALAQKPEAKERFLREARAAAALEHDHIVAIHQVDEDRGVPYIAMPFLKGLSLEDFLQQKAARNTPLKLAEICKIGREMARGLAAAHERGLIHRDIKPANVWLDASAGGRVKILDFGLARLAQQGDEKNLTQSGAILGTPAYMAPEQAKGDKVDARTDLFSLGVVLYRLCTGELPFRGPDLISTLMAVATTEPASPQALRADLPRELADLVMHLLAKEPAKRPASAKEVVKAIASIEKTCLATRPATAAAPAAPVVHPAVPEERQDTVALQKPSSPRDESQPSGSKRSFRLWLLGGAAFAVVVTTIVLLWSSWQKAGGGKDAKEPPPLAPLSPLALVSRPAKIPGIESWTIEPRGHRGAGDLVEAFSGDGKQFATGGGDGTVRLWEPSNGQLLRVLLGHEQKVTTLAFSPDGKTLASGSADATVRLWDPTAGKLLATLTRHAGPITALAWSADGKTLASGSADKLVLLWDPVAREERRRFDHHQAGVVAVAWQSDRTLASADGNNTVWLWEAGTGKPLQSHKVKRPSCWSANRKVLAYKSGDKEVTLWDPAADRTRAFTFKEINGALDCLNLSPDGKILATGGGGGGVHCWDADSGQPLLSYRSGSTSSPGNLYFSPNGKILIERLWRGDGGGYIWPGAPLPQKAVKGVWWGGAYVSVGGVKWSPDSKTFVAPTFRASQAGAEFDSLLFFDPSGKDVRLEPKTWSITPNARGGGDVAWSPDGKLLAVGDPYKKVRIQEADSGKVLHLADEEKRELPTDSRSHLDWSPDGKTLAIYQGNLPEKRVRLFDARTGARLQNGWSGPPMRAVAWSPDNKTLATSDENATYLYDAGSGKQIGKIPVRGRRDTDLAWSPDSQVLATGGASVKLWKANSGAALPAVFAAPGTNVQAVAWSPDGKTLAAGDAAGAIRLHDAQTGALRQTCQGHEGPIHTLAWMPDSETFLSLGEKDGTVCSWKVGVETPARVRKGLPGNARFSPDRKFLAARHDRRGVQIWEMDRSRLRGTLLSVRSDGWQPPDRYLAVSADGHYRISGEAQRHLVYVIQTATGQDTLTPEEFEKKYVWKNDPDKVRLTSPE